MTPPLSFLVKRRSLRWLLVCLAAILLLSIGATTQTPTCACEKEPVGICLLCEAESMEPGLLAMPFNISSLPKEEQAYPLPVPQIMPMTDLEQDHPPPRPRQPEYSA